jgi:ubiquinone/menaquinone biosynthesis C-methylase UbiE
MSLDRVGDYHQILDRTEREHWWFIAHREFVVDLVTSRIAEGSQVLDIGCSTGHVIAAVPAVYERTGADVSPGAIELARALRPEIRFLEASAEELPLQDRSLDCAFALDVLSDRGVHDETVALREIRRVLRPGGLFVAQFPAYEWLKSGYDDFVATARRYTARSVKRLLEGEGFEVEHLTYRVTALFVPAAVRRLLAGGRTSDDLSVPGPRLNRLLTGIMRLENRVAAQHRLPFGLSVFAVAVAP